MPTRPHRTCLVTFALAVAGGCVAVDRSPDTTAAPLAGGCPKWGCGDNSPLIDGIYFHELGLFGQSNDGGLRIVDFRKAGASYALRVDGDRLMGDGPGLALIGDDLVGAEIVLTDGVETYIVYVEHVSRTMSFEVAPHTPIETYRLGYSVGPDSTTLHEDVCPEDNVLEAMIFTGDRYGAAQKTVTVGGDADRWFNIACAGSAPAKMHIFRHTTAGSTAATVTSQAERQALLKMFAADYCGTGESFTFRGQPLTWSNGWSPIGAYETFEAVWDESGALCLDVPRLAAKGGPNYDPNIGEKVSDMCPWLERCDGSVTGYVSSANPPPGP